MKHGTRVCGRVVKHSPEVLVSCPVGLCTRSKCIMWETTGSSAYSTQIKVEGLISSTMLLYSSSIGTNPRVAEVLVAVDRRSPQRDTRIYSALHYDKCMMN